MRIGLRLGSQYKRLLLVAIVAVVTLIGGPLVGRVFADSRDSPTTTEERIISIYDRGVERVIITKSRTLRKALEAADVKIAIGHDVVEPALDTELIAPKYNVNIYRARPVIVVDGAVRQRVTTAEQTPERIAAAAKITLHKEDIVSVQATRDLLLDGAGVVMTIDRAKLIELTLYGKKTTVRTQATTVGGFLEEKGIVLAEKDSLSAKRSDKVVEGMSLELWREGKQTITQDEEIDFPIEKIQDADREIGYREVKSAGKKGKRTVTYEIEMKNGHEISRKEIASLTTDEPKKQIEVVGVKNNYSSSLNEWLYALRMCETHGNYQTATGNGYYGAYQFLPATWNNIAKREGRPDLVGVLPSQAAPADQDAMVIANANATSGLSTQHPGCYKKLGLSNKPPAR